MLRPTDAIITTSQSTDTISISRERMASACRADARRVVGIAAPLFTVGFFLEAASHLTDPYGRLFLQPLLSAMVCAAVWFLARRSFHHRVRYPELILLGLLWLVVWSIALHLPSEEEPAGASALVMLAVATVGSATLIIPPAAALVAIGSTTTLYMYAQTLSIGLSSISALVAPVLILLVVTIIHFSRRSAIRSVEELRERVARDQQQLQIVNEQLRNLSITDALTGALNRRGFDDRLTAEAASAARTGEPLSVLLLDVDNFKHYNDEFGHPAGDAALLKTTEALRSCCRASDSVARYGGEEFAMILPATGAPGCRHMAERVRRAVATLEGLARPITVSVGAATAESKAIADQLGVGTALVACADSALYRAKEAGRDRSECCILSDPPVLGAAQQT